MRSGRQHCCSSCSRTAATGVLPLSLAACVALLFIVAAHMHIASAAPWDLATYKLCAQRRLAGMRDNASGAAYSPATHTLWVLGGRRSETKRLFEYNAKNGNYIRQVELVNQIDAEALTWTGSDGSGGGGSRNASTKAAASGAAGAVTSQLHSLTMAEEDHKDGGLVTLDVRPGIRSLDASASRTPLGPPKFKHKNNKGIEGLAWDPDSGLYYAAQEDTPQRLLAVRPDGSYSDLVPGLNVSAALGLRDLSGLHYVSQLRRLLVLSQESNAIVVLQLPSGKVLQRRGGILTGYRPEGITATPDGRMLFVVAEPDVLAVFKPDQCD